MLLQIARKATIASIAGTIALIPANPTSEPESTGATTAEPSSTARRVLSVSHDSWHFVPSELVQGESPPFALLNLDDNLRFGDNLSGRIVLVNPGSKERVFAISVLVSNVKESSCNAQALSAEDARITLEPSQSRAIAIDIPSSTLFSNLCPTRLWVEVLISDASDWTLSFVAFHYVAVHSEYHLWFDLDKYCTHPGGIINGVVRSYATRPRAIPTPTLLLCANEGSFGMSNDDSYIEIDMATIPSGEVLAFPFTWRPQYSECGSLNAFLDSPQTPYCDAQTWIPVSNLWADFDDSEAVDLTDLAMFLNEFRCTVGWPKWGLPADINSSGQVEATDLFRFLSAWYCEFK